MQQKTPINSDQDFLYAQIIYIYIYIANKIHIYIYIYIANKIHSLLTENR